MEQVPISELKADGQNPNKLDRKGLDRLKRSIQQYGFIVPIITNKDLLIADGEQRWIAANELAMKEVSVIRLPVEDVDRRLLRQVLNKLRGEHELLADALEFEKIIELGREDDLKFLLDLNDSKLERYLRELHPPKDEDYEIPEIEKIHTDIKRGDIIQLGKHRLMCGDSCLKENVDQLMNGNKANMIMTDPPYGVNYAGKNEFLNKMDKGNRIQTGYANDSIKDYPKFIHDWMLNFPLADYNTIYIWTGNYQLFTILQEAENQGLHLPISLVWVKNNHVLTRQDYYAKHELCLYGWKNHHKFYGEGTRTTVLLFDKPLVNDLHPTMKPIELIAYLIPDGSRVDDIVYDSFGGSGSTLIACEQTGRVCYMMEIDPRYCEIICQRWEKYTGQKRKLIEKPSIIGEQNATTNA